MSNKQLQFLDFLDWERFQQTHPAAYQDLLRRAQVAEAAWLEDHQPGLTPREKSRLLYLREHLAEQRFALVPIRSA